MPKVEAVDFPGLYAWFNSDDHLPPHFHLEREEEWEVKVRFRRDGMNMFEIIYGDGPTGPERKLIIERVTKRRAQLLVEWEKKVLTKTPGKDK